MTVRTAYFGGLNSRFEPAEADDVFGVVRYPKDFVERLTDRNIPAVAPPADLLEAFKTVENAADRNGDPNPSAIAWDSVRYEPRYLAHLEQPGPSLVVDELRDRARERDVWLVCWEKDARWCHRRLLANAIVADLEDVDVVHHPDPSTIPLEEPDESPEASLADFAGAGGA
ncbi:DUF488 family protein [Natronobeatus ordinarius]|uniref:DUF488 family protein, N3 subclade n=1 Tax=Natronobeatus ordinarius TaxID=2963433 RepID=UPI0020CD4406|nr:DUF488 family protein [Natronobeatus ordinarius]